MNHTTSQMPVAQAALALGVSERTVWRYLRSGRLAGATVGAVGSQRTLVDATAVQSIIASRCGGEEIAVLTAEVARLGDEVATVRADRDQLRTALLAARGEVVRLSRPVSHRAGDLVLAGLASLGSRTRR